MDDKQIFEYLESEKTSHNKLGLITLEEEGTVYHIKALLKHLKTWSDAGVKQLGITVAAKIIKRELLENNNQVNILTKKKLIQLLRKLDPQAIESFLNILQTGDFGEKETILKILDLVGKDERIRNMISNIPKYADIKARATAVSHLKYMTQNLDFAQLNSLLKDSDHRVVANCVEVIETIISDKLMAILKQNARHPNNRVRANALKALWNLGYDKIYIYHKVREMAAHPDSYLMRASALWMIGECCEESDASFIELIEARLTDENELVVDNAIKAVIKIGGKLIKKFKDRIDPKKLELFSKLLSQ